MKHTGFVLIAVLWVLIVVGLVGLGFHNTSSLELKMTRNLLEETRARAMADSGIERAVAELRRDQSANKWDSLNDTWADSGAAFDEAEVADGSCFTVYKDSLKNDGRAGYGLVDEESKVNINAADENMLLRLPGMTQERVDSLLDWRDTDDETKGSGAESAYYLALSDPYKPRNGPFSTLDELLLVKGFDRRYVLGEDWNGNGVLDPAENDGDKNAPPDNSDGKLDRGLLRYATLWSYDRNQDGDGKERINVNKAEEKDLTERLKSDLTESEVKAVIKYRDDKKKGGGEARQEKKGEGGEGKEGNGEGKEERSGERNEGNNDENIFASIADIMNVPVEKEKFIAISDKITVTDEEVLPGRINVNTAPKEVLVCLFPEEQESLAEKIISRREEQGAFEKIGDLLKVPGIDVDVFRKIEPHLCVRSNVFTIRSLGYREKSKALAVTQAVIDRGQKPLTVKYRRNLR
jgi:type II secretory pathway component PulK